MHAASLTTVYKALGGLLTSNTLIQPIVMSYNKELDPYSAKAQNDNLTPQEKVDGLHSIVKKVKTGMLTTRSADGLMHSRAMAPAGRKHLTLQRAVPH